MKKLIAAYLLVLIFSVAAYAHSAANRFWGEVPVDMLLSGDVLIVKPLIVPEDVTLTVEAGTVVRFEGTSDGGNGIVVKGRLVAAGTKEKPIKFIPKDKGRWRGIEFTGSGGGRMENCLLSGATVGIIKSKNVTIKNIVIK